MTKSRTTPFTSSKSAKGFADKVGGKVTSQYTPQGKEVHHVHYKSDGQYKGNKSESNSGADFDSDLNRNGTHWHDSDDI